MEFTRLELVRKLRDYTWDEDGWYVPLDQALAGLTAAQAAWQPPGGGNSIWQIVNHLNFYNERVLRRNAGEAPGPQAESNSATFGGAGDPADDQGWETTIAHTRALAKRWRDWLNGCEEADLDRKTGDSTPLAEEAAIIFLHDAYHTGQIVQLRKLQGSFPATS